jgi:hypothetical protein
LVELLNERERLDLNFFDDPETYVVLRLPEVLRLRGRGKTVYYSGIEVSGSGGFFIDFKIG